jgi:hypothetical protein
MYKNAMQNIANYSQRSLYPRMWLYFAQNLTIYEIDCLKNRTIRMEHR